MFIIINFHVIYFNYVYNQIDKIGDYHIDDQKVTYTNKEDNTDIIVFNEQRNIEKEINEILISRKSLTNEVVSKKYLTICRTENCMEKDIIYMDKGIMYKDNKYYHIYNYEALENIIDLYNIDYCSIDIYYDMEDFFSYYSSYIESVEIVYDDTNYSLNSISSNQLFSFLSSVSYEKLILNSEKESLNYKIVIAFKYNDSIIFDFNGEIYFNRNAQSCTRYFIRSKTQRNKLSELIRKIVLTNNN